VRQQGHIETWLDDRGFGFITPERDNQRLFVHIKSFPRGGRRPVVGAAVSYIVRRDGEGRLQAAQVAFTDASMNAPASFDQLAAVVAAAFAVLGVGIATTLGRLPVWVMLLYTGASLLTFLAYALDKSAAHRGRWRISERTLHALSLAGGWPGALIAQRWLRHKSKKPAFQATFWVTVAVNVAALAWFYVSLSG
jgi:uncharacterized membrane protein YsdA (DUF1294 family)/cold shock CspA family protein